MTINSQKNVDIWSQGFWRPWLRTPGEKEKREETHAADALPSGPGVTEASGKLSQYQHPVRLFWPKSKCYDYLYQEAETLLKNFPIQATISFYEDSDSENEIEGLAYEN
ncbi:protein ripply2 isoform X2 [Chionomys nivalis]|uniref:protein ripply2 isoform X2 n=1 Tax=Chionomys nivalis TaxID=269649 RepID=UPI002591FBB6|nr:protein ripply2 isoform X2 [Chionomys nivalis]